MRKSLLTICAALLLPAAASAADPWEFQLSPYLWFAGLEGKLTALPTLPPADVDISSKDALDDTESSLMLLFAGKKGGHGFIFDFIYTDVRSDEAIIPEVGLKLRSTTKSTVATLGYQYELYRSSRSVVDAMLGARYWDVDSDLRFKGGLGGLEGVRADNTESWIDPAFGFKGRTRLGDSRFYLQGTATIGGFGVESELFWGLNANVLYAFTDSISAGVGYRVYDVEYDKGDYLYDVRQEGWLAGLNWTF